MLVSFLENYTTLGKVAKSLLFEFCFGKLVETWHFKRSLFFSKNLAESQILLFPTNEANEAKWVFQKCLLSKGEYSSSSLKMCPDRAGTLSTPCRTVGCM